MCHPLWGFVSARSYGVYLLSGMLSNSCVGGWLGGSRRVVGGARSRPTDTSWWVVPGRAKRSSQNTKNGLLEAGEAEFFGSLWRRFARSDFAFCATSSRWPVCMAAFRIGSFPHVPGFSALCELRIHRTMIIHWCFPISSGKRGEMPQNTCPHSSSHREYKGWHGATNCIGRRGVRRITSEVAVPQPRDRSPVVSACPERGCEWTHLPGRLGDRGPVDNGRWASFHTGSSWSH